MAAAAVVVAAVAVMGRRHTLALVGGAATLLASLPLVSVFDTSAWLIYAAMAVGAVVGTAMLVRALRGPVWLQVPAMMVALLLFLTWSFPSGEEFAAIIPTPETFAHFDVLLSQAGVQVREQAVPVPDLDGLLLLATVGIGIIAILVNLAAVGIGRPALAGLPMLAIYSVPVAVLPDGVNPFAFFFGAAGYLWLLASDNVERVRRFGRRFSGEGRDVDVWEPSPLSAAGRRLGVVGLALALVVPLALPGMTTGLLERFGTGPGGPGNGDGGGRVAVVDLTALLSSNLNRSETFEMVRVRTSDPNPYYLRLGTADQLTEDGFVSVAPTGAGAPIRELPEFVPPTHAGVSRNAYGADITVTNLDMPLAPHYTRVTGVTGLDNTWFFDEASASLFSRRASVNGKGYHVEYVRLGFTPQALRTASTIPQVDQGARALTVVPQVAQVSDLVDELTLGKSNQYDRVRAIHDYFDRGNGFTYSLSTEPGDSGNPIVDFLTNKKGFCVQYAAAMAWMVREAGYPARVAFGFTRGNGPTGSGEYVLTNLNLHAWTEVFFPDFGWVPFDPTPASSITGSVTSSWAPPPGADPADAPTLGPGTQSSASAGPAITRAPGDEELDNLAIPDLTTDTRNPWGIVVALVIAVVLVLALLPSARRRALRRNRRARGGALIELGPAPVGARLVPTDPGAVDLARRDAHNAWAELLDTMIDFQVDVDPSETPRATAERLARLAELAPPGRVQAGVLAQAEERARYARTPLPGDHLDQAVRTVRDSFRERASRADRLRAALFPRSVLRRWRSNWIGFASRNVTMAARIRQALLVVSPRRILTRTR